MCQIRVAGSPGPVYRSLLEATRKFLMIVLFLLFVFIVVLSFGETYNISSTNQMLATMAGGFMPFMFRNIFRPSNPEVETNLLSFKSKLEEVIKHFCQTWPMYDLVFDVEEEPKSDHDDDKDDGSKSDDGNDENINSDDDLDAVAGARVECKHCHGTGTIMCKQPPPSQPTLPSSSSSSRLAAISVNHNNNLDAALPRYEEAASLYNHDINQVSFTDRFRSQHKGRDSTRSSIDKGDKRKKSGDKSDGGGGDKKDKDKKDKKQDKDWLTKITRTKTTDIKFDAIQSKLDELSLEPAEGQKVDILIYVTESDQDWLYERSSISDYADAKEDVALEVLQLNQPKPNGHLPMLMNV